MRLVRNRIYRVSIIMIVLASFTPAALISKSAEGALVGSQMILPDGEKLSVREVNVEKIRRALENKVVAEKLKSYGLSKEEVMTKIEKMNNDQVHQLAALSDRIPAGGDAGWVIGILVIVVLVLVILY